MDAAPAASTQLSAEVDLAGNADQRQRGLHAVGKPSGMSCPDCGGNLTELGNPGLRYRCHVGHAWSADALLVEQSTTAEQALWLALRTLEEKAALTRRMIRVGPSEMSARRASRYQDIARECEDAADVIRGMLLAGLPPERAASDDLP